jgi:cytochrome b subunit of formate dehydrogenase
MLVLVVFLVVHIAAAFAVEGTITSMFTGRLAERRQQRPVRK